MSIFTLNIHLIATGKTCNMEKDREIAYICLINQNEEVEYSSYIMQKKEIVSYLDEKNRVNEDELKNSDTSLSEAMSKIKSILNEKSIIVAFNSTITDFLGLEKDVHYEKIINLAEWFKSENSKDRYCKYGYQYWTVEHIVKNTYNFDISKDSLMDTKPIYFIKLYNDYKGKDELIKKVQDKCRENQYNQVYKKKDLIDGVCLGHIKSGKFGKNCYCGHQSLKDQKWAFNKN
jgi:hypothetical protein